LKVNAYALDTVDGTFNFVGAFASKNQVGFFSSFGIFLSLVFLMFYRRNWLSFFWTAPIILMSAYMLAIAHSATSVASLPAVFGVVILLTMSRVLSRRYRRVLFVVGGGALVGGVVAALNLGLLDVVLGVFGKDSTLTGRTYLWQQG
ncbi:O-antigen ligase family protein, partial [Mesorhizobium sp. M8A.F.Ca.ET.213.01.1.1]